MVRFRRAAPLAAALAVAAFVALPGFGFGRSSGSVQAFGSAGSGQTKTGGRDLASHLALVATEPLTTGCNQITLTGFPVGSKVSDWLNQNVQPASAVVSVWHFNNTSQSYQNAFFKDPNAPVDVPNFQSAVDSFFICVNGAATAP